MTLTWGYSQDVYDEIIIDERDDNIWMVQVADNQGAGTIYVHEEVLRDLYEFLKIEFEGNKEDG